MMRKFCNLINAVKELFLLSQASFSQKKKLPKQECIVVVVAVF